MNLKLSLSIVAVFLVVFSLNCFAELEDNGSGVFYSAEQEIAPKDITTAKTLESSGSESNEWYSAETFEKRSPTGAKIVRSQHSHDMKPNQRNEIYLRPQQPIKYY
uniref:Secreted protein n=1 Tax=Strongyloides venezuelensis TaxID=75913 RepID=A0A0K0F4G4_STRVS